MMEDFLRESVGEEYADIYKNSTKQDQTLMDINFIAILARGESKQSVSFEKETIIKDGKMKVRYILEADLKYKTN